LCELEEAVLVGADLVDVDVVEAGILEGGDLLEVIVGVRAADDNLLDGLFINVLGGLLEVPW
jgi:hypothetical protein